MFAFTMFKFLAEIKVSDSKNSLPRVMTDTTKVAYVLHFRGVGARTVNEAGAKIH
jgi:hypothetical protein